MEDKGILKCYFVSRKALLLLCFLHLTMASFETPASTFVADNTLNKVSGGYSYMVRSSLYGILGILYYLMDNQQTNTRV